MRLLLWLPLALVAGAPNIIYVVVDDLDQMLGSSFPQPTATPLRSDLMMTPAADVSGIKHVAMISGRVHVITIRSEK